MSDPRIIPLCLSGNSPPKMPKYAKRMLFDLDTKKLFVAARLFGRESVVVLTASYDATSIIEDHNHFYVPTSWCKREYPQYEALMQEWESQARRMAMSEESNDE